MTTDGTKPFRRRGLGYCYELPADDLMLSVDYLHRRDRDLNGELVIATLATSQHIYGGRFNLSSVDARQKLPRYLAPTDVGQQTFWRDTLETFCAAVRKAEDQGPALVKVGRRPARERPPDLIERLIPSGKVSSIYGACGVGKGNLAVAACVCVNTGMRLAGLQVQQGRSLYLDWEDDPDVLDDRVKAVSRGLALKEAPEIDYLEMRGPLRHQLHRLKQHVSELQTTFLVVDSVGLAMGVSDSPRQEEGAILFFEALRYLAPVTVLLIDHVSEQSRQNKQGVNKAYGTLYKMNLCRKAWEVRKDQETNSSELRIGCYLFKANYGTTEAPLGFLLDFGQPDALRITRQDVRGSDELAKPVRHADRIAYELRSGPLSGEDLAAVLQVTPDLVRTTCNRNPKRFIRLLDGRWGLMLQGQENGSGSSREHDDGLPF